MFCWIFAREVRGVRKLWRLLKEWVGELADALDGYEG